MGALQLEGSPLGGGGGEGKGEEEEEAGEGARENGKKGWAEQRQCPLYSLASVLRTQCKVGAQWCLLNE